MALLTDRSFYLSNREQPSQQVVEKQEECAKPLPNWPQATVIHDGAWDQLDDSALLAYLNSSIESQSDDAFQALYNRYHLDILRFICSRVKEEEDAKDIFCEVWTVACARLPEFEWREGTKSVNPVKSWLLTTTWNFMQEHFRRREREATVMVPLDTVLAFIETRLHGEDHHFSDVSEDEDASEQASVQAEADLFLQRAMKNLSPPTQQILSLIYFGGKNATEVGVMLGLKPGTVRQQHKRGLEKLRKFFEACEYTYDTRSTAACRNGKGAHHV